MANTENIFLKISLEVVRTSYSGLASKVWELLCSKTVCKL